ncbi:hypothetical protein JL720_13520 [Aureococcus anophagefferens]|nr:hypothetical protein JL720_13520 [Aureococcus anophagefferens]
MASLLSRAKELREQAWPTLKTSAFLERGVLTPEEFVAAGDELVFKCPTWTWSGGDAAKRKAYLPAEKQFLVTNNVPCAQRAAAIEGATLRELTIASELAAARTTTLRGERHRGRGRRDGASDNILRTRTYDLSITYDKYWQTPRMWLFGYDEASAPLTQPQIFEDILSDYAKRTVTFERHPHLDHPHASIHPCKHPNAMKKIIDNVSKHASGPPRVDQAMFIFLKFISNMIPTINYDFTHDVQAA